MMIRAYLDWSRTAGAAERAEAVAMLAVVYLDGELSQEDKRDAEAALVLAVDDPSPLVRRELAVALGGAERAPRAVISALARDLDEIAAVVVANSPLLTDAEIADIAVSSVGPILEAACARPHVSQDLAAALAVAADATAARILLANPGAEIPLTALSGLAVRHGEDTAFREELLSRDDLPADILFVLTEATARHLTGFCTAAGWLQAGRAERLRTETVEAAIVTIADDAGDHGLAALVERLRREGRLTPQVLLRSLLSGDIRFFAAALADLAEIEHRRAVGFVQGRSAVGFAALCRKAGLPRAMDPAFAAAIAASQTLAEQMAGQEAVGEGRLSRVVIETVLSAVALLEGPDMDRLRAVLMGYLAEAMRDEARLRIADILTTSSPVVDPTEIVSAPVLTSSALSDSTFDAMLSDAVARELVVFDKAA